MKTIIATVEGCKIWKATAPEFVEWTARGRVDVDGTGAPHGDTCYQSETSLKQDGQSLNADVDRYIVVHPSVISAVRGVVLGCSARVTFNGLSCEAVVGDVGPRGRLGELSRACAIALGIDPSPVSGGVDEPVVRYAIWPGVPAVVGGKTYKLQPSR